MRELVLGVDIGGTKTSIGLVDSSGYILHQDNIPTNPKKGFEDFIERLLSSIHKILLDANCSLPEIKGIGVGCPGPLDLENGTILNLYTLPSWEGQDIVSTIRQASGLPTFLENDADAALLGELFAGAARGHQNVAMLTLGTGVGGAVLNSGKIYRGFRGEHPEFGHIPGLPEGPLCYCGLKGCLESLASGTAITNSGRKRGFRSSYEVFRQARSGNPMAREIIDRASKALSQATWMLLHTFVPEMILLGGGIMDDNFDLFKDQIEETLGKAKLVEQIPVKVSRAELGNQAGIVGAAYLVMRSP
ncbi:MAG: ROK family protein [Candidatus Neomarinimicrobiota bacterium]